jgi:hypothetical protein
MADLVKRVTFIRQWLTTGQPTVFWLPGKHLMFRGLMYWLRPDVQPGFDVREHRGHAPEGVKWLTCRDTRTGPCLGELLVSMML